MSDAKPRPGLPRAALSLCSVLFATLVACNQSPGNRAPTTAVTAPAPTSNVAPPLHSQVAFPPAPPSTQVSFTLEGCRNDGSPVITLPNASGKFICPDAAYTSGNLGKGWNELDLVPHRLTASVGTQSNATTVFSVILAADYQLGTKTGYDVVTVPEINAAKSDASCAIEVQDQQTGSGVTGGADTVVYRTVNITLAKGKTCVIDYTNRLALGAAQYSGSSLQAYMFEKSDFSTGKRTIPLPVKEILPQQLSKEMSASQGRDQVWDVSKQPTPATVNFGDVCAPGAPTDQGVQIKVAWEIVNVLPGNVTLLTKVYATNPAARVITVNVTDNIYQGADQSLGVLDTASAGPINVPANTANYLILSHAYPMPTSANLVGTAFNDVATATYTDLITGVPVPGTTTAAASTTVSAGTVTNASAAISDSESITGSALTFAVATPSLGSFSGYTAGTFVTGPVNWSVSGQTAAGGVTFNKTVRLGSKVVTSGTLSDTAILTGSDAFSDSASASVGISSSASVSLTINKTIPKILQTGESQSFTFVVKDSSGKTVATPTISFAASETSKSVTVGNLDPGTYTVSEDTAAGWNTQADKIASITLPSCSGSVSFDNTIKPANAKVVKTVVSSNPADTAQGWNFTLTRTSDDPDTVVATGTTDADGKISFTGGGAALTEGTYTVTENQKAGYDLTSSTGCTFSVNYPADADKTFTCAAQNTKRPTLKVTKVVVNDNGGTAVVSDFTLKIDTTAVTSGVVNEATIGSHTVSEGAVPAGYTMVGITGDCNAQGQVTLAPGDNKACTITNTDIAPKLHLRKVVINNNGGTKSVSDFPLLADGTGSNDLSGTSPVDSSATLQADTWALSEIGVAGYTASNWVCVGGTQSGSNITVGIGGEATCTITNDDIAPKLHLRKIVVNDNGGTATPVNFTLTANGTGSNDLSGTSPVDSGATLQADTWTLGETGVAGYTASNWVCVGGTQSGSNITVGVGGEATCTITNDDQPGKIVVIKNAKPANGSFTFTTTGSGYGSFPLTGSTAGSGNVNSQILNAGTYTVKESTQLGWVLTGIGGSTDPSTPYNCVVSGSGGSTGVGDLNTQTATISLKIGDTVTCTFENTGQGVTRTQGFWATHPNLSIPAWNGGSAFGHAFPGVTSTPGILDAKLCTRDVLAGVLTTTASSDLMGSFWSGISKTSTNKARSPLDQARMQLLQQLIAAELNASAFGSVPAGGVGMFAAWENAYCGTNASAISLAQQQAASFNTSGDSSTFTPGTSANSKVARTIANYVRWDSLP